MQTLWICPTFSMWTQQNYSVFFPNPQIKNVWSFSSTVAGTFTFSFNFVTVVLHDVVDLLTETTA